MSKQFKTHLDPDKYGFTEKETRVLLEDVRNDFQTFGDALQLQTGRIDGLVEVVGEMKEDLTDVKVNVKVLNSDVSTLKSDVSTLKSDVSTLKTDVKVLKTDVSQIKEDISDL